MSGNITCHPSLLNLVEKSHLPHEETSSYPKTHRQFKLPWELISFMALLFLCDLTEAHCNLLRAWQE